MLEPESEDEQDPVHDCDFERVYGKDYAEYMNEIKEALESGNQDFWLPYYEL